MILAAFIYGLFVLSKATNKVSVSSQTALTYSTPSKASGLNSGLIGVADIKQNDL